MIETTPAWKSLSDHCESVRGAHLREHFRADPERASRLTVEAAGIWADFSKQRVTAKTVELLLALAEERGLKKKIEAMFRGDKINATENRAVLHVALRLPKDQKLVVDGVDVVPQVHKTLERMSAFAERVRSGEWKGFTGRRIRNVVNIG